LSFQLEQAEASVQNSLGYRRVLRDTPGFAAITLVAPGERFNALAILVTPCLSFARRTSFFFFAISGFAFGSFRSPQELSMSISADGLA